MGILSRFLTCLDNRIYLNARLGVRAGMPDHWVERNSTAHSMKRVATLIVAPELANTNTWNVGWAAPTGEKFMSSRSIARALYSMPLGVVWSMLKIRGLAIPQAKATVVGGVAEPELSVDMIIGPVAGTAPVTGASVA